MRYEFHIKHRLDIKHRFKDCGIFRKAKNMTL